MEEVDKIIIDSLRHLNCDIDNEITSLKQFEPDLVLAAISTCLETIISQVNLPKKLPISMSAKIKIASTVAQQIRELGFKGDMGYQTILYCNEVEVRRVLMYLIEHLPKDSSITTAIEPIGYVPRLIKTVKDSLRQSLSSMWLPSEVLYYGTRDVTDGMVVNSFGNSCSINKVNLVIPTENLSVEECKYIPEVTKQCNRRQLIPSLLFQEDLTSTGNLKEIIHEGYLNKDITEDILENVANVKIDEASKMSTNIRENNASNNAQSGENKIEVFLDKLREKKTVLTTLQNCLENLEENLQKIKKQNDEEQKILKNSIAKVKIKNTTMAVLHSEENKIKLKNAIQKSENRLIDLTNQWNEVQSPLLEEHKALKSSVSSESLKCQEEQNKYHNLKTTYRDMVVDFKEKSILEQNLIEKCKELSNKTNRAAYTKRILEIVGNIKKQNHEIHKVLTDTKLVQKDISNLTGQVDRSFTLSDELIFYDCKQEEMARKAYKLLAALREECNGILQAVSDMGQAEREMRNLEEQVETERNKEIKTKIEKVRQDLDEIKKEIQLLM